MIPRDPDFVADGDSSLFAVGGFSTQLYFWWHLEWLDEIQDLRSRGLLYQPHVLGLIKADNTAAESWAEKAPCSSVIGNALVCLQAALMIQLEI
eukprot:15359827-Ditylum_brightwellii.AAC.1